MTQPSVIRICYHFNSSLPRVSNIGLESLRMPKIVTQLLEQQVCADCSYYLIYLFTLLMQPAEEVIGPLWHSYACTWTLPG